MKLSSLHSSPPMERGTTAYDGSEIDLEDLSFADLIGREWLFPDLDYSSEQCEFKSDRLIICRLVRNTGSSPLLPGRRARFMDAGAFSIYRAMVDGHDGGKRAEYVPTIDEYLPKTGVPPGDCCWVIMGVIEKEEF